MKKTVVINVVGLTKSLIGKHTPFLSKWSGEAKVATIKPVLPAVTCSAQATYLTGKFPTEHGVVGNGWYFKDECEVKFWRQSNKLVQSNKIWEMAKELDPKFTCANMFWWYNMYSSADYSVTPRPMYPADGRKLPDVYSQPSDLRDKLQQQLGTFPLFDFWGPRTTIRSTQWIADASKLVEEMYNPTLLLIYLPHLDYNVQRYGTDESKIAKDLNEIDRVCEESIKYYEAKGANVIVLSEYGITNVHRPVHLNRLLRENGLLAIREELGLELLDAGASQAFSVADHQVAHVYVNDKSVMNKVRTLLETKEGVELVLDEEGKRKHNIVHERAGDFVVVADKDSWFTYYYWLNNRKAPDFARTVDIHRKPGYDPAELFTDPNIKFLAPKIAMKLLKKKLGFRYLMDVISLDATLVRGSHGRLTESDDERALIITKQSTLLRSSQIEPTEVCGVILSHLSR
ncbi:MAG: alkaline phosphatase family protein [Ignavibacteriae bacterium]|nr:alkaline phosphatase family protein [Ignavibacteriota bacterium]